MEGTTHTTPTWGPERLEQRSTHTGNLQEVPELLLPLLLKADHSLLILIHTAHHVFYLGQQLQCLLLTDHGFTVKDK